MKNLLLFPALLFDLQDDVNKTAQWLHIEERTQIPSDISPFTMKNISKLFQKTSPLLTQKKKIHTNHQLFHTLEKENFVVKRNHNLNGSA